MKNSPQNDQRQSEAVLLAKNYQKYPREVAAALVARYRPDAKSWAARFRKEYRKWRPSIPARDYEAIASACIQIAAKNYDSGKGASFKTYWEHYVKWECYHYAKENGDYLKVFEQRKCRDDLDEEKATNTAVYAIPWDELTDGDLIDIVNDNPRREREKKTVRRVVQQLRQFLNELLKGYRLQENQNRLTVPQKRAALVLEYIDFFLKHADDPGMGRTMKTAFLASKKKKCRETLDKAIDYVIKQFSLYSKTQSTNKPANLKQTKE